METVTHTDIEFNSRIDRIALRLTYDQPVDQFHPYEVAAARVFLKGLEAEMAKDLAPKNPPVTP